MSRTTLVRVKAPHTPTKLHTVLPQCTRCRQAGRYWRIGDHEVRRLLYGDQPASPCFHPGRRARQEMLYPALLRQTPEVTRDAENGGRKAFRAAET